MSKTHERTRNTNTNHKADKHELLLAHDTFFSMI